MGRKAFRHLASLALALCLFAASARAGEPLCRLTLPLVAEGTSVSITVGVDDIGGVENISYRDELAIWREVEKRLGIDIRWEVYPSVQYSVTMRARFASGNALPDVLCIPGTVTDAIEYSREGMLLTLTDLIYGYAPDIVDLYAREETVRKGSIAPDGEIYFLPNYIDSSLNGQGFVIRQDWLNQLGLESPDTMEEWLNTLRAFRDHSAELTGGEAAIPFHGDLQDLMYFFSGFGLPTVQDANNYWFDDDGQCYFFCMRDEYRDWLAFCGTLYREELLDPYFGAGSAKLDEMIKHNRVGSFIEHTGVTPEKDAIARKAGIADVDFVWLLPPMDGTGARVWYSLNVCRNTERHGITATCENPVIAIQFLDYVYASTEGTRITLCGLENVNYTLDAEGGIVFTDEMMNDPAMDINQKLRSYGMFDYIDIQTREFNAARIQGKFKRFIDLIADSPDVCRMGMPVLLPNEDEQKTIASIWPDIEGYIKEASVDFITGRRSLEEFDAFRAKLQALGIDELAEAYQAMYDRYMQS